MAVNGIIVVSLAKARPDEVKFMMVDPKMVELGLFIMISPLAYPSQTIRKASRALQKVVDEMENRHEPSPRLVPAHCRLQC